MLGKILHFVRRAAHRGQRRHRGAGAGACHILRPESQLIQRAHGADMRNALQAAARKDDAQLVLSLFSVNFLHTYLYL